LPNESESWVLTKDIRGKIQAAKIHEKLKEL